MSLLMIFDEGLPNNITYEAPDIRREDKACNLEGYKQDNLYNETKENNFF